MTMPRETILFWVLAAALVAVGLAFILAPLLRRRDAEDTGGKARRPLALLLTALVPAAAIGLYVFLSRMEPPRPAAEPVPGASAEATPAVSPSEATVAAPLPGAPTATLEGAPVAPAEGTPAAPGGEGAAQAAEPTLTQLEARVQERPDDGEGWLLLGQRYVQLERAGEAVEALKRATELLPEKAGAWSAYAEAMAMERGTDLDGEPMATVYKALELDVKDPKALELAGLYHFSKGNYKQAGFYWTRLLRVLPEGTPFAEEIESAAREARRRGESGLGVTLGETLEDALPRQSPTPAEAPAQTPLPLPTPATESPPPAS